MYPSVHRICLLIVVTRLMPNIMMSCIQMGGCRILLKDIKLSVASIFGEQLKIWRLWYSSLLIMKSMMQIIMHETSLLSYPTIHILYVSCNELQPYWTRSFLLAHVATVLNLIDVLLLLVGDFAKAMTRRMLGTQHVHCSWMNV